MPTDSGRISFIAVEPEHYVLLAGWLRAPHMRQWWGDPDEELTFIRDMVEGRDSTRPFLIMLDRMPVDYIQYWFVGHHQNEEWSRDNPWLLELPSETVGVDLSIGDATLLSKGIGTAALVAFVTILRERGIGTIIIDPDPANRRAVRAYEKAGFRTIEFLKGRTGDSLIMQFNPDAG